MPASGEYVSLIVGSGAALIRSYVRGVACAVALVICVGLTAHATDLGGWARAKGVADVERFVGAVEEIRRSGRLPEWYLDKREAERRGWRPGGDLCRVAPGKSIGGDRFLNLERILPDGRWREADIDATCGRRGAKRLVYSSDGVVYLSVDHYRSFERVP